MLVQILLLIGGLIAAWMALDWFKRARPAAVKRTGMVLGLAFLVVIGLWLVMTGKLAGLFAVAAGLSPWIMRAVRLHGLWRMLRQMGFQTKGGQAGAGQTTRVETHFLRMELDHDANRLDGEVAAGGLRGRRLSELTEAQAWALWRAVQADADSQRVLETWLDRAWPDWRAWGQGAGQEQTNARPPSSAAMTDDEARAVLGVGPHAGPDEIRAAHRRLMMANHPDHGGSTWIAARINQAKDLLLKAAAHE